MHIVPYTYRLCFSYSCDTISPTIETQLSNTFVHCKLSNYQLGARKSTACLQSRQAGLQEGSSQGRGYMADYGGEGGGYN